MAAPRRGVQLRGLSEIFEGGLYSKVFTVYFGLPMALIGFVMMGGLMSKASFEPKI